MLIEALPRAAKGGSADLACQKEMSNPSSSKESMSTKSLQATSRQCREDEASLEQD